MRIEWISRSDVGRVRKQNEDSTFCQPDVDFTILCDGMGGHQAGEVASRIAVETFRREVLHGGSPSKSPEMPRVPSEAAPLVAAALRANQAVFEASMKNSRHLGMGCTLVALRLREGRAAFVTIGDSRLYLFRDAEVHQISEDHTRIRMLRKMGVRPSPVEEMQIKGVITRAVGTHPTVEVDYGVGPTFTGDVWLLCSDGLTDEVTDEAIRKILLTARDAREGAKRLIEEALAAGGHDNVTVVIGRVMESPARPDATSEIPVPATFEPPEGQSDSASDRSAST